MRASADITKRPFSPHDRQRKQSTTSFSVTQSHNTSLFENSPSSSATSSSRRDRTRVSPPNRARQGLTAVGRVASRVRISFSKSREDLTSIANGNKNNNNDDFDEDVNASPWGVGLPTSTIATPTTKTTTKTTTATSGTSTKNNDHNKVMSPTSSSSAASSCTVNSPSSTITYTPDRARIQTNGNSAKAVLGGVGNRRPNTGHHQRSISSSGKQHQIAQQPTRISIDNAFLTMMAVSSATTTTTTTTMSTTTTTTSTSTTTPTQHNGSDSSSSNNNLAPSNPKQQQQQIVPQTPFRKYFKPTAAPPQSSNAMVTSPLQSSLTSTPATPVLSPRLGQPSSPIAPTSLFRAPVYKSNEEETVAKQREEIQSQQKTQNDRVAVSSEDSKGVVGNEHSSKLQQQEQKPQKRHTYMTNNMSTTSERSIFRSFGLMGRNKGKSYFASNNSNNSQRGISSSKHDSDNDDGGSNSNVVNVGHRHSTNVINTIDGPNNVKNGGAKLLSGWLNNLLSQNNGGGRRGKLTRDSAEKGKRNGGSSSTKKERIEEKRKKDVSELDFVEDEFYDSEEDEEPLGDKTVPSLARDDFVAYQTKQKGRDRNRPRVSMMWM